MIEAPTVEQPKGLRARVGQSRLGTLLVLAVTAAVVMGGSLLLAHPTADKTGAVSTVDVGPGDGPAPKIGNAAHDFTATTVDGKKVSLSSYKGQAVWLTFGASWCSACQAEAPDIEAAYKKHQSEGVVVLAVSINEDIATVLDYGKRIGLTYPQIADSSNAIASAYRVSPIPVHFFVDKAGILHSEKTGQLSPDQMDTALKGITK
jgi:peroxiredoxin